MTMRILAAAAACWLAAASGARAIPYIAPPQPVYQAPIDRALANVAADQSLDDAQRERLLGRLNVLAFARNDAAFAYRSDDNNLVEAGSVPCSEAPRSMRSADKQPEPTWAPGELCAQVDFYLGPQVELPLEGNAEPSQDAYGRLRAAREHYQRAVELDRTNLRALLGLAFTQDRLGDARAARTSLRALLRQGLPRLSGPQSEWEDHAVLTEASEHLSHLAKSIGDHAKVNQLRERLGRSRPMIYVTPIVAPLSDAPFERLINPASPVAFDFAGTGDVRAQGWLKPDAAWLVWDPEGRGEVRSGFDLIGARTWAVFWSDGFEALRALDDNRDGELTGAELGGLALWRDANANGVSDAGEIAPLDAHGVAGLAVRGAEVRPGLLAAPAGLRLTDGRTRPLYDWTPGLADGPARVALRTGPATP